MERRNGEIWLCVKEVPNGGEIGALGFFLNGVCEVLNCAVRASVLVGKWKLGPKMGEHFCDNERIKTNFLGEAFHTRKT